MTETWNRQRWNVRSSFSTIATGDLNIC